MVLEGEGKMEAGEAMELDQGVGVVVVWERVLWWWRWCCEKARSNVYRRLVGLLAGAFVLGEFGLPFVLTLASFPIVSLACCSNSDEVATLVLVP